MSLVLIVQVGGLKKGEGQARANPVQAQKCKCLFCELTHHGVATVISLRSVSIGGTV